MLISLDAVTESDRENVGGKAMALATMTHAGLAVPPALCLTADAYLRYVQSTGLLARISLELSRKAFDEMRWEEMWDAALRIRSMFLREPIPGPLEEALRPSLEQTFGTSPVVVRSSGLMEDTAGASFAGLHESYVNVRGTDAILDHIRLVWASLWSDAALMYRQELGLDVETSAMPVVVQELLIGDRSGVAFTRDPTGADGAIIESVWGLNQGLVDGTVEPDRWTMSRAGDRVTEHFEPERSQVVRLDETGVSLHSLPVEQASHAPLDDADVQRVIELARRCEELFGSPQDVEWTFRGKDLFLLQSRPITTGDVDSGDDQRAWNLSLRPSFDSLTALRRKIEEEQIPAMVREADELAAIDVAEFDDAELAAETERRVDIEKKWTDVYWEDFIPFAHGARLFGQVYGDVMRPDDPYEFTDLLRGTGMASMERNALMEQMAATLRDHQDLRRGVEAGEMPEGEFAGIFNQFYDRFAQLSNAPAAAGVDRQAALRLVLELARHEPGGSMQTQTPIEDRAEEFLSHFEGDEREWAEQLLDLARVSYRLRDDDNIYLGRIQTQVAVAADEIRSRLSDTGDGGPEDWSPEDLAHHLRDPQFQPAPQEAVDEPQRDAAIRVRQLTGQPAGSGLARGPARLVLETADAFEFRLGEVLVCDAVDPNMTFVVPLATAIVERRGGMLIHGAIIAREYGLPCVTGIPHATEVIATGDTVTVDGYLGIVTVGE